MTAPPNISLKKKVSNSSLISFSLLLSGCGLLTAAEIHVPADYETITAAINQAGKGDVIIVAPGTYQERIVLKPRIELRSAGEDHKGERGLKRAEVTIINGQDGDKNRPGVTMAEGAILDGFTVTGVGRFDEKKWQKSWDKKGEDQAHEHIGGFGVPGIAIIGVSCQVRHNIVHHIGDTGIAIQGEKGKRCAPLVVENICYRNMGGGIGSMNGSAAVIESNTCFENFYAGIGHNNASPVVKGNICHHNVRAGIGISEGASPLVRGNRCYENRRAGIGIRTGSKTRPIVEDNDCYENEMAGIGCDEEASPVIRRNRCHRNKLAGIGSRAHSTPFILENHCHENGAAGIGINTADAVIVRNHVEKNKTSGIGISGKSKASVIGNTCLENRLVAVGIPNGAQALLHNNTLVRSGGMPPIVAILGGSRVVMTDNRIKGGGIAGIMLGGRLDAIENIIEGQKGFHGILAKENSEAILSRNKIKGYRVSVTNQKAKSVIETDRPQKEKPPK